MNFSRIISIISNKPAWIISVVTAAISFILPFVFAGILALIGSLFGITNVGLGNFLAYLLTGVFVAMMCFFICKAHPKSIWYTPILCNSITLFAGLGNLIEGNPDVTLPFAMGWVLSIIASLWGGNIGKRGTT